MTAPLFNRRDFSLRLALLFPMFGAVRTAFGASAATDDASKAVISHVAETIHQEVVLKAGRKRVYEAFMDDKQFTKATGDPAEMKAEPGGAFSLFGARIKGRNIELVPNERIVQAWRSEGWPAGVYSIARFELVEQGSGTRIVFDHTGFPVGDAESLAIGWQGHYWDSLQKYFA
jgi:activator of HSP90 ATPase